MCFLVRRDIDFLFSGRDYLIWEFLQHCPPNASLLGRIYTALLPQLPKGDKHTSDELVEQFLEQTKSFNDYAKV